MRATDLRSFGRVSPEDLKTYIAGRGWVADDDQPGWAEGKAEVWVKPSTSTELLVPLRAEFKDYSSLVSDACDVLAEESATDPMSVVREIASVPYDTIRLRAQAANGEDTLGLRDAVVLLQEARTLISAVAASSVEPRPTHPRRRPPPVNAYLSRLQMAQTERGSFVLAIRSPVGVRAQIDESSQMRLGDVPGASAGDGDALTGRAMAVGVYEAVYAATNAVPLLEAGDYDDFQAVVHAGVSSNLYAALARLATVGSASLELTVRWSPRLPLGAQDRERLSGALEVPRSLRDGFRRAAEHLRSLLDPGEIRVVGPVTGFNRETVEIRGRVTIQALVAGTTQHVQVVLSPDDYRLAMQAHEARTNLALTGTARRQGRHLVIDSPSDIEVLDRGS